MKKIITMTLFLLLGVVESALAESVPPLINYQGMLTDSNGKPLANGTKKLSFKIYDSASATNAVWGPQVFPSVPVINGYFNVILGPFKTDVNGIPDQNSLSILDAFSGENRYLGITVEGEDEITPRQQILSTPYAISAKEAEHAKQADNAEHTIQADLASGVDGIFTVSRYGSIRSEGTLWIRSGEHLYIAPKTGVTVSKAGEFGNGNLTIEGQATFKNQIKFTGGQGPFCIFSNSCPTGWTDKGIVGFIIETGYPCPYSARASAAWNPAWFWCHPKLCCN